MNYRISYIGDVWDKGKLVKQIVVINNKLVIADTMWISGFCEHSNVTAIDNSYIKDDGLGSSYLRPRNGHGGFDISLQDYKEMLALTCYKHGIEYNVLHIMETHMNSMCKALRQAGNTCMYIDVARRVDTETLEKLR